jgi:hypothetical protein
MLDVGAFADQRSIATLEEYNRGYRHIRAKKGSEMQKQLQYDNGIDRIFIKSYQGVLHGMA